VQGSLEGFKSTIEILTIGDSIEKRTGMKFTFGVFFAALLLQVLLELDLVAQIVEDGIELRKLGFCTAVFSWII
jgi:hypothetical protein